MSWNELGSHSLASRRPEDQALSEGDIAAKESERLARRAEIKAKIAAAREASIEAGALLAQLADIDESIAVAKAQSAALEPTIATIAEPAKARKLLDQQRKLGDDLDALTRHRHAVYSRYLAVSKDGRACPAIFEADLFRWGRSDLLMDLQLASDNVTSIQARIDRLSDARLRFSPQSFESRMAALTAELQRFEAEREAAARAVAEE
jgi:hypothetical protein